MLAYPLNNILFLDIETVPQYVSYDNVPDDWKKLWAKKADLIIKDKQVDTYESIYSRAGIYSEFGKIICISCGIISGAGSAKKLVLKSFNKQTKMVI